MKKAKYIFCITILLVTMLLACKKKDFEDIQADDSSESDIQFIDNANYNYPIEQVVNEEIFTKIIEGDIVPVAVKLGIGGVNGYTQKISDDAETINQCIEAMKEIKIKEVITNPDDMIVIFDGIEDYIFVLDDGTEFVLGTDLSTYVKKDNIQYVLEGNEKLMSLKFANDVDFSY